MSYFLDDWLYTGDKLFIFSADKLAGFVDGGVKKLLGGAVKAREALKIGEKIVISEKMLRDYSGDLADFLLKNDGFLRFAVGEQFPSLVVSDSLKIENYGELVYVPLSVNVDNSKIQSLQDLLVQRNKTIKVLTGKHVYARKVIVSLERTLENYENAPVAESVVDSKIVVDYEARIAELQSALEKKDAVITGLEKQIIQYDARLARFERENDLLKGRLDKFQIVDESKISGDFNTEFADLMQRIKSLELDLRVARREIKPDDGMIVVPAVEYNELCDSKEQFDDVFDELKKLRSASKVKFRRFKDDLSVVKAGVVQDGKIVAPVVMYCGELISLPHVDNHLFRAYEVLHLMKLQGERDVDAVYLDRDKVINLMNTESNKDSKCRAFERWKQKMEKLGISWKNKIGLDKNYYFGIDNFDVVYRKVFDLLTFRDIYDSSSWRIIKSKASSLGLDNVCLCADSVKLDFVKLEIPVVGQVAEKSKEENYLGSDSLNSIVG